MTMLSVALGAAVGAPAWYVTGRAIEARHDSVLPWEIPAVDLVGSFVLGLLTAITASFAPALSAALGVGFCGALTIYSTLTYGTLRLVEDRTRFYTVANIAASLLGGLGAVGVGWMLGTLLT